jgi:preprotein translocase subunit SecG
METALKVILIIVSLALIAVVLLQSGRSAGLSGAISGASEQLLGKQKARGIDALLGKLTVVFGTVFILLTLVVAYIVQ